MEKKIIGILALSILMIACKKDAEEECTTEDNGHVTQFFANAGSTADPSYTVIADGSDRVNTPQDLDFHPNPSRKNELWILNKEVQNTGSSTVTISNAGKSGQSIDRRIDGNAWHFMSLSTALAFSPENENFGTSPGVFDANHNGGAPFTGPALWSSDMDIYARYAGPGTNGSHLDMLHESPYSMGIAHEKDNVFWIFDGNSGQIVRYDFKSDHGPGNSNHDDGEVIRYTGISVLRKAGVPSHMVIDKASGWMYICDTGNKRILRMKINSGAKTRDLPLLYEVLASREEYGNPDWEVFADTDLVDPCGIEVIDNRLFVSDNATNKIIAYQLDTKKELARIQTTASGIKGIKVGPDNHLWYVDYSSNEVVRIDPN
ncbi:MAG: hypothetical protein ABF242_01815 [Flavobacteriales bacterium]